jgi:hypothetical protein
MTYGSLELSTELGRPVELYHFVVGTDVYRYTSAEDEFTSSAGVFLPRNISHTAVALSSGDRKGSMELTLPADDPIALCFLGMVPGQPILLTIYRAHRGDAELYNVWSGRVVSSAFRKNATVCTLACLTTEATLSQTIPSFKYQGVCNHVLYTGDCGVSKEDHKYVGELTVATGSTITVPGLLAAKGAGWALGGYVSLNDVDYRLIIGQAGDVLTLTLDFGDGAVGQVVSVYAGCPHSLAVCVSKFNNAVNYGGYPYVPILNPFGGSLQ